MTYGTSPYGTVPYGTSRFKVTFDVEKQIDNRSIILVSDLAGKALIQHFQKHPEQLKHIDRRKFEEFVAELFTGFGFNVELTQQTRDGGVDIIAIKHHIISEKFLIECKRPDPNNKISVRAVRELLGVKYDQKATKAILVTTTSFSPKSQELIESHQWELEGKDYDALMVWIDDYLKLKTPLQA